MAVFIRNVVKLASGSAVGQLAVLAAMPVMARLYSPEHFGVAQAALSLLTVLLIVGALRLETALLSVSEAELSDLFKCAWWLCCVTAGLAVLVATGAILLNAEWTIEQRLTTGLLPILGLLASWNQLMSYISLRQQAFGPSAHAKILQPTCYAASALGLGTVKSSTVSLLLADMFGRIATTVYLSRALHLKADHFALPDWRVLKSTLYRHRELVSIGLISSLINAGGSAFTAAMLLWLFGAFEAGQYAMVERMIGMPVGLLVASLSQVFMANLSKALSAKDIKQAHLSFKRLLHVQLLTGLPVALALYYFSPILLEVLLGAGWETAGTYAKALTLLFAFSYIVGPMNMTLTILGRQKAQLLWDCFRLAIVAITWGFIWSQNLAPATALWLYSISASVTYASYVLLAEWTFRNPVNTHKLHA